MAYICDARSTRGCYCWTGHPTRLYSRGSAFQKETCNGHELGLRGRGGGRRVILHDVHAAATIIGVFLDNAHCSAEDTVS